MASMLFWMNHVISHMNVRVCSIHMDGAYPLMLRKPQDSGYCFFGLAQHLFREAGFVLGTETYH